jgi:phage terminase large subunit-like protein
MASTTSLAPKAFGTGHLPKPPKGKIPDRAQRVIDFCELMPAPGGIYAGQKIELLRWQRRFLRDLYGPTDKRGNRRVRRAILSVGRRQGKTLLCALLVLVHLIGPERKPNGSIYLAANDAEQARTAYKMACDIIRMVPRLSKVCRIIESANRIKNERDNIEVKAISAAPNTKLGQGPDLIIYDEAGNSKTRELYEVLQTSLASQAEPLMILPSTQAATDSHWFSELVDYGIQVNAGNVKDPSFLLHLYTADPDLDPFTEKAWRQAQPALGYNVDLEEVRGQAKRARDMPSGEPAFRNFQLNQRVQTQSPLITPGVWKACGGAIDLDVFRRGPVYGGLDLSQRQDLTALVLVAKDDAGRAHALTYAWTPHDTLLEREHTDRAPYTAWVNQGTLQAVPGSSIGYDFVAADIARIAGEFPIETIRADRWRVDELQRELDQIGASIPLVKHGQGYKDMSPAVDKLEHVALERILIHGDNPVLTSCVANCVADTDAAGNRKPAKNKSLGRIDAVVALMMALEAMRSDQVERSYTAEHGVMVI